MRGTPITPYEYSSANDNGGVPEMRGGAGRPSPYIQPPSAWLNQRPPLDVNVAYVEGREDAYVEGHEDGERGGPHQPTTRVIIIYGTAQFDKVTSTKSRSKCTLKDGIMHKQ
ncbi:unnamed protein product [Fraxinus pennsylvanica]|uniref:Uncharacterized protein n=1 Tax=Fraxinus pennsylvanica TaxID=56036 RepID=A0AAD2E844_9LAMI|nr:unnamed protein product [Fraxinus pennsylvanica]